jgi:hypothetical protein
MPQWAALTLLCLPLAFLSSCFSDSLTGDAGATAGAFKVVGVNVPEGQIWELNREIRIEFNHPIDPDSIGFDSIVIAPTDPEMSGHPVTGSFSLDPGSGDKVVIFHPTCPTNDALDNGAFLPGGVAYRLELPTQVSFGVNVLRDTGGHFLTEGLARNFYSPTPPTQNLFLDYNMGPAMVTNITWPSRLNFYTDREPTIQIQFDQSIDGRSSNLNTERIHVQYSDNTLTNSQTPSFALGNEVAGEVLLFENCTENGSLVWFQISGILPPDHALRLVVEDDFADISGQVNQTTWFSSEHDTPTLTEVYASALFGWQETDETIDEFADFFDDTTWIDPEAQIVMPPAEFVDGVYRASFDYKGQYVSGNDDFYWDEDSGEIRTDGQYLITDSNNRSFNVYSGVLYVDDFEITAGSTLRGRGSNPLIIYAQGEVEIYGTLDVGGNNSHWPTSLNSPQFPVGPVQGECGGGLGGMASKITNAATYRGDPGDGPFGFVAIGGVGGEGGIQQTQNIGSSTSKNLRLTVGGGGGGTFAKTPNEAIWKDDWSSKERPGSAENNGPDHHKDSHTYWPDGIFHDPATTGVYDLPVFGGEDGMRGSSWEAEKWDPDPNNLPSVPHGTYGMEDEMVDVVDPKDSLTSLDSAWNTPTCPLDFGHPTNGPDPGPSGASIFSDDGDYMNDFWGRRLNDDGTITVGELLTPWAGSGGGASGDSQTITRTSVNGRMLSVAELFPASPFPPSGGYYRKGAPGGGGGGQLQIMAIGPITIGNSGKIDCNGGIGHGGESVLYTYGQISGSGGGSGGHLVLHSATKIDLSQIYIGVASTPADLGNLSEKRIATAVGGRRGWCNSIGHKIPGTNTYDGNGDLMLGRGGAGGNGVIQFHVPDPADGYAWPTLARDGIRSYIHNFDLNGPVMTSRLEEILYLFAAPRPYALLAFFSSGSQFQSTWIDTGYAGMRLDPSGNSYPKFQNNLLEFDGTDGSGFVDVTSEKVVQLPNVATGTHTQASFGATTLTITDAASVFSGQEHFLRHPAALVGYSVLPNQVVENDFEIVDATYLGGTLTLITDVDDGSMSAATSPTEDWAIRPRFFSLTTQGAVDSLPSSTSVRVQFQGTDDPSDSSSFIPSPTGWGSDLSALEGLQFIRYRVTFDIDATDSGVSQASPKPEMSYIKLPFSW